MKRSGFTLVELLVVIAVISILVSLGFVMVKNVGSSSRHAQTESTLVKIDAILAERYNSLTIHFDITEKRAGNPRIRPPAYIENETAISNWHRFDGDRPSIELLAKKDYERKHFPMTFDDCRNAESGVSQITGLGSGQFPPSHDSNGGDTESAECLYWMLTEGSQFGNESAYDFTDREIADTDGDGLLEFVDGWGQPLRFYRWPTRLIRPRELGTETIPSQDYNDPPVSIAAAEILLGDLPSNLKADPCDPMSLWETSRITATQFEVKYHTPSTWYSALVVSAGQDGEFGLHSPVKELTYFGHLAQPDNRNPGAIYDNITNSIIRVGGK